MFTAHRVKPVKCSTAKGVSVNEVQPNVTLRVHLRLFSKKKRRLIDPSISKYILKKTKDSRCTQVVDVSPVKFGVRGDLAGRWRQVLAKNPKKTQNQARPAQSDKSRCSASSVETDIFLRRPLEVNPRACASLEWTLFQRGWSSIAPTGSDSASSVFKPDRKCREVRRGQFKAWESLITTPI